MENKSDWNVRNHIILSNKAANHYDNDYAANNYQTRQYMAFEEDLLLKAVSLVPQKNLAIDLGCGTGRDLFKYSSQFKKAIGWDFSSEMVSVAQKKVFDYGFSNVIIEERDIEKSYFEGISNNSVNFMNAGFGMGSFIKDFSIFLEKAKEIMAPNGIFMTTFYNKNSIINQIPNSTSLAAVPNIANNTLTVNMGGNNYVIPCISYSVEEIVPLIKKHFELMNILTYPMLSLLIPSDFFKTEPLKSTILKLEHQVSNSNLGHYIIVLARKL